MADVPVWDCRKCDALERRVLLGRDSWGKLCPKCGAKMSRGFVRKQDLPKGGE
jgi:predicted nucleic acid-binding Zn ribbon protein